MTTIGFIFFIYYGRNFFWNPVSCHPDYLKAQLWDIHFK